MWLKDKLWNWVRKDPRYPLNVIKEVHYQVVQLRQPSSVQWTKEIKDAVATLPSHPGFVALMDKLSLQRAMIESKLTQEYRKDLRENDWLQAGVFWLGYLDVLIGQATQVPRAPARDAMAEELEAFNQINAQIERIGGDTIA